MGFFDRLFGREEQQSPTGARGSAGGSAVRSDDEIAVERYEYLLRTAPPETIEQVHTEAFAKLTPAQRDILFQKLTEASTPAERPADAEPATLAKAATRAELQQPGTMSRTLGGSAFGGGGYQGGPSFGSMVGSSILGTVAGYVIGSALVSAFMPNDYGDAANGDYSNADGSSDSGGADASADGGYSDGGSFADGSGNDGGYSDGGFADGGFSDGGGFDGGGDFGGDFGGF